MDLTEREATNSHFCRDGTAGRGLTTGRLRFAGGPLNHHHLPSRPVPAVPKCKKKEKENFTMQEIFESFNHLASGIVALMCVPALIYGILECFFGYKIMKILFAIQGFFLGFLVGAGFAYLMGLNSVGPVVLSCLIFAILGAMLLYKFYLIGVFLSNASMVFLVGLLIGGTDESNLIAWAVIGVIVGVLAVKFVRIWVIAVTGIVGGLSAGTALMGLLEVYKTGPALLAGIILAVLGILYQWKTTDGEFVKTKKRAPAQAAPVSAAPVQAAPVYPAPVQTAPVQAAAPEAPKAAPAAPQEEMPAFLKNAMAHMD